jgi:hypothetical protein
MPGRNLLNQPKKKAGRPPYSTKKLRTFQARLEPSEWAQLDKLRAGRSLSEFFRDILKNTPV